MNQFADSRGSSSLELGAGGGLVGLAVASQCGVQDQLLLTDQDEMLELMRHNIELNGLGAKARPMVLNWCVLIITYLSTSIIWVRFLTFLIYYRGEALPATVVEQKPNVILAAECVYFEPAFPLLMHTLKDLLALNQDAVVYFCFKKRRRADMRFVKMAKKTFQVDEVFDEDRPVFQRKGLFFFTFRSKGDKAGNKTGEKESVLAR